MPAIIGDTITITHLTCRIGVAHFVAHQFNSRQLTCCNSIGYIKWNIKDGAGWEVRCLCEASSSLKTPAIPPFYKIISDNQSTKLVYNLVYSRGSSFKRQLSPTLRLERPPSDHGPGVTEGVSWSDLDLTKGGGAAGRRGLRLRGPVYLIGW